MLSIKLYYLIDDMNFKQFSIIVFSDMFNVHDVVYNHRCIMLGNKLQMLKIVYVFETILS